MKELTKNEATSIKRRIRNELDGKRARAPCANVVVHVCVSAHHTDIDRKNKIHIRSGLVTKLYGV